MDEQPIRIVVDSTETHFVQTSEAVVDNMGNMIVPPRMEPVKRKVVFQRGMPLPVPEGTPQEPLIIIDIIEYAPDDDEPYYLVFSVGRENSEYERNDIGIITRIPASLVIRKDSRVSATEMVKFLREQAEPSASESAEPPQHQQQQTGTQPGGLAAAAQVHPLLRSGGSDATSPERS